MSAGKKASHYSYALRLFASVALAAFACLAAAPPATALDINPADYFQLTWQPVTFDKTQVAPGEVFHTTISGRAVCNQSIPLPVSQATITSQVIARDAATGASYTLDPGFTININPFPDKAGETFDVNETLALQFPQDALPGRCDVVWQPIEARARISFIWTDVTDYFPAEQEMGAVTVTGAATGTSTTPAPTTASTTVTAVPTTPPAVSPTSTASPATPTTISTSRPSPQVGFVVAWWAFPLGAVVFIVLIIIIIVLLVRRR